MDVVGVDDAFSFLKAKPETRDQIERRLRKKLDAIMSKYNPRVAAAVRRGEQPDYDAIFEEMRAAIQPEVTALTTTEALRLSVDTGIVFDPAVINTYAVEWARDYTYKLVTGITDTERKLVRQVERTFFETPGMTQGDLERLLGHAFGPVRAEMIAVTETTRAAAQGTNEAQRLLNETGFPMIRVWNTANDDLVCPICGPLNGQPESVWSGEFGLGPPAHPRCRCGIGLSAMDEEVHLEEARVLAAERDEMLREMGLLPATELVPITFQDAPEKLLAHYGYRSASEAQRRAFQESLTELPDDVKKLWKGQDPVLLAISETETQMGRHKSNWIMLGSESHQGGVARHEFIHHIVGQSDIKRKLGAYNTGEMFNHAAIAPDWQTQRDEDLTMMLDAYRPGAGAWQGNLMGDYNTLMADGTPMTAEQADRKIHNVRAFLEGLGEW